MNRVLVLENDEDSVKGYRSIFGSETDLRKYSVDFARTCRDAYVLCRENKYDLYCVGDDLDDGTGLDFLKSMKSDGKSCPSIITTSMKFYQIYNHLQGANSFLVMKKPLDQSVLSEKIKSAIGLNSVESKERMMSIVESMRSIQEIGQSYG